MGKNKILDTSIVNKKVIAPYNDIVPLQYNAEDLVKILLNLDLSDCQFEILTKLNEKICNTIFEHTVSQ